MKKLLFLSSFISIIAFGQTSHQEIGVEIDYGGASNLGGNFGVAAKYSFVEDNALAYGPMIRYNFFWSNNIQTGVESNRSFWGGGVFLQYRFFEWLFLGTEVEVNQTFRRVVNPDSKFSLAGFIGGGIHHDFGWVQLNGGIMFDVVDAIRDPLTSNPSNFSLSYRVQKQNPNTPNQPGGGGYIPIVSRITFFFPINR